ncbi:MAG: PAS domain S-box protein [Bacteroidota bacterium]
MPRPIHILHLEDNPNDAELVRSMLEAEGMSCTITCVESRNDFLAALQTGKIDLIISDFTLPAFDGLTAMTLAREQAPEIPFIFVSGTLGEESAIQSMVNGATDYVLKSRLTRLIPAVSRALREADERRELKRAAIQLRESEELFRLIAENAADLIAVLDPEGRRLYNSPSYNAFFSHAEKLPGTDSFADIHPDDRERVRGVFRRTVNTGAGERIEYRFVLPDGRIRHIESQGNLIRSAEGVPLKVVVVSRDITARKEAERALLESEERYRGLIESARDAIYTMSPTGVITSLNIAFERLTGWRRTDWIGKTFLDLLHPDDRQLAMENFRQVIGGSAGSLNEYRFRKESGEYVVGEVTATAQILNGRVTEVLGIVRDVTERKALEEGLRKAQKMESLGTLAGGIAHDFNNILSIIMGHAALLDTSAGETTKLKTSVDAINQAASRGAALVKQLLTFARKGEVTFQAVQLNDLVHEVINLLRGTLPKTITLQSRLQDGIPLILADPTQVQQILLNLCVNSRDAMPDGGSLIISTGIEDAGEVRTKRRSPAALRYIRVDVTDSGTGMDDATAARIFEPFFTTKEAGKGTGLGLAVVFGIMNNHNGFIDVDTAPGKGTTFHLWFPVHAGPAASEAAEPGFEAEASGGSETILIVEDEEMLRDLVQGILTTMGYATVIARDGIEALDVYRQVRPDLVLSDLGLPRRGGDELFRELQRVDPQVNVVFASGYLDPRIKADLLAAGAKGFIQKPYVPGELLKMVRRALDEREEKREER